MTAQENNKEGTDDFQPEWETDTFESTKLEGLERDKRGELVVLLPVSSRTLARLQGFSWPLTQDQKEGQDPASPMLSGKGGKFTGVLHDEEGEIAIEEVLPKKAETPKPDERAKPEEKIEPGHKPVPDDGKKPGIMDFDLDFGPPTDKVAQQETTTSKPPAPKHSGPRPAPSLTPYGETTPLSAPESTPSSFADRRGVSPQKPGQPDSSTAPLIIDGPAPKPSAESEDALRPAPPHIESHSYLEEESVVEGTAPKLPRPRTGKKMKLPKRVREGRSSPLLVIAMILLFLVLTGVLLVQHVPEARKHYDNLLAEILGKPQAPDGKTPEQQQSEDLVTLEVGAEKVLLKKGTDTNAAMSYVNSLGKVYAQGRSAVSVKER